MIVYIYIYIYIYIITRGLTSRGEGEGAPCLFLKIERKGPDLGKNALIVFIYGSNFLIQKAVSRVPRNLQNFSPVGSYFNVLYMECLS